LAFLYLSLDRNFVEKPASVRADAPNSVGVGRTPRKRAKTVER
jgi:hypothetical protein